MAGPRQPISLWACLIIEVLLSFNTVKHGLAEHRPENSAAGKPNVLFLMADDLRPELGPWIGKNFPAHVRHPIYTPNVDSLAKRSLVVQRAYTQMALCSPSRTSLLTGRRPDTTQVFDGKTYFRSTSGNFTTIPQYFKKHGYRSIGMGKIFHPGLPSSNNDDPPSWSDYDSYYRPPHQVYWGGSYRRGANSWRAASKEERKIKPLPDESLVEQAIKTIRKIAPKARSGEQPFFLGIGFYKPHLPFVFPKKYLDLYPLKDIELAENDYAPVGMPPVAWSPSAELLQGYSDFRERNLSGAINSSIPAHLAKQVRRAYFCSVSYIDDLVGQILAELDAQGLRKNTIISFIGDHGWKLGEHGAWSKHTNFELDTHTPLMISIPGLTDGGKSTEKLVELVDLYPTLVEAAGLPLILLCPPGKEMDTCTEGMSLMSLIKDPKNASWKDRAMSQYIRYEDGDHVVGYSMRTDHFRYTEWVAYDRINRKVFWDKSHGAELYDHRKDPQENHNKAKNPKYQDVREKLSGMLRDGWRAALPLKRMSNI